MFKKAVKEQMKLRVCLSGPSGAGKTYTALNMAQYFGSKIAVIDTEHNSSIRYANKFEFDVCDLTDHRPQKYIEAINAASSAKYDVIIIDSLSHAWYKILELAGKNYYGWEKARPVERELIEAILACNSHVIVTMREKSEYQENQDKNGKKTMTKTGTEVIQNKDITFEFDIALKLDREHIGMVDKTRCEEIDGKNFMSPGKELAEILLNWANDGTPKDKIEYKSAFIEPETKPQAQSQPKQQPVKQETEDFPKPPAIWDSWKNAKDAVDWAKTIIQDADDNFLFNVLKGLPKTEDKGERGKLWIATINEFHQSGNYKKVQPEPVETEELEPVF